MPGSENSTISPKKVKLYDNYQKLINRTGNIGQIGRLGETKTA